MARNSSPTGSLNVGISQVPNLGEVLSSVNFGPNGLMHDLVQQTGLGDRSMLIKALQKSPDFGALLMTVAGIEALVKVATGGGKSGCGCSVPSSNFANVFMAPIYTGLQPIITQAVKGALGN